MAEYARLRRELPGSARAKLREASAAPFEPAAAALCASVCDIAGAPSRIGAAWRAAETAEGWREAGALTAEWLESAHTAAAEETDEEKDMRYARTLAAAGRCGRCGRWWKLDKGGESLERLVVDRCNTRACLECTRARLRKVIDRWAPLYAAPIRPGFHLAFVTIGSRGTVGDRAGVSRYLRAIGRVCRVMREGSERHGIPARSWVAGVRALEVLPRGAAGWSHAHLAVVRAAHYPYGLSAAELSKLEAPTPAQRGLRALLRECGIGEVFDDSRVMLAEGEAVGAYMSKVAAYVAKVSGGEAPAGPVWGRDLLNAMKGARLLQPFGDALGLMGGPDRVAMFEDGARLKVTERGRDVYDPADDSTREVLRDFEDYAGMMPNDIPAALRPDDRRVERVTYYRADIIDTWGEWCDVAALRALPMFTRER